MLIKIFYRNVYGNALAYPAGALAAQMARLLKVKTFNPEQLALMRHMGFELEVLPDPMIPFDHLVQTARELNP